MQPTQHTPRRHGFVPLVVPFPRVSVMFPFHAWKRKDFPLQPGLRESSSSGLSWGELSGRRLADLLTLTVKTATLIFNRAEPSYLYDSCPNKTFHHGMPDQLVHTLYVTNSFGRRAASCDYLLMVKHRLPRGTWGPCLGGSMTLTLLLEAITLLLLARFLITIPPSVASLMAGRHRRQAPPGTCQTTKTWGNRKSGGRRGVHHQPPHCPPHLKKETDKPMNRGFILATFWPTGIPCAVEEYLLNGNIFPRCPYKFFALTSFRPLFFP